MAISVIGINYKTAPVDIREKVYFSLDKLPLYLQDLLNRGSVSEAVLLSTCNRSELYCDAVDIGAVREWFCAQTIVPRNELESALYIYRGEEAIAHIMQVASGLDSMVLGEPQILGQLKAAFSESCSAGAVGALFHRLFQQIFAVAKEIRHSTAIGACPVSVASAAVHFAKQQLSDFAQAKVVVIGAGDTSELLMRYLQAHLTKPMILVNRSLERAATLIETFGGSMYGMDELAHALAEADIVFSATGSATPIINKTFLAPVMAGRTEKSLTLIDIAVPRDIDPSVNEIEAVTLHCIDDLKNIIEKNKQSRSHAADKALELISSKSRDFYQQLHSIDKVAHAISAYRGQVEDLCDIELQKAKQLLLQGVDPVRVLHDFAHAYTQKLLHAPSVQLRQAGVEGRFELLRFAKQLFSLPDAEIELS